nr:zf-HC2 domain-containing protein [Nocardioides thalensis]
MDAAYVLGSLAPAERADYERHLRTCEECSRSVRELAGLPGLLARVPADVLEPAPDREPVPATLLPGLVAAARRSQRLRVIRTSLVAAAAVAVLAVGVVGGAAVLRDDDRPPVAAPPAAVETAEPVEMTPVGTSRSSGWVSLTPVTWGTRLDLTCTYRAPARGPGVPGDYGGSDQGSYGDGGTSTYTLVVRTTDGRVEQAAAWAAITDAELHVTGAASVQPDEIASVEVRTAGGHPVLRLER